MNKRRLLYAIFGEEKDFVPTDETVEAVLSTLTPREKLVIEERFADKRKTLEQVGKTLPRRDGGTGVVRTVVMLVEHKALRKLRHPSRAKRLGPDGV